MHLIIALWLLQGYLLTSYFILIQWIFSHILLLNVIFIREISDSECKLQSSTVLLSLTLLLVCQYAEC